MEFRQCPTCRCMKNIRKNRTMCIRCEKEFDISKQEYCRALLCIENGKEKHCGDIVMGKVRYCARHSLFTGSTSGGKDNA